jgi:hypothetical protein
LKLWILFRPPQREREVRPFLGATDPFTTMRPITVLAVVALVAVAGISGYAAGIGAGRSSASTLTSISTLTTTMISQRNGNVTTQTITTTVFAFPGYIYLSSSAFVRDREAMRHVGELTHTSSTARTQQRPNKDARNKWSLRYRIKGRHLQVTSSTSGILSTIKQNHHGATACGPCRE